MRRHGAPFRIALNLPSVGGWDDGLSTGRIDDPGSTPGAKQHLGDSANGWIVQPGNTDPALDKT